MMMGTFTEFLGVGSPPARALFVTESARWPRDNDDTEKSEDPTQKRLDDALKRGDVAKSQEVVDLVHHRGRDAGRWCRFPATMGSSLKTTLAGLLANSWRIPADGGGLIRLTSQIGFEVLAAIAIPLSASDARGVRRQHDPASPGLVGREPQAETRPRLAARRHEAAVLQTGAGRISSRACSSSPCSARIMTVLLWPERDRLESLHHARCRRHSCRWCRR